MQQRIRIGALVWVLCLEFYVAQLIAQLGWPEYSMIHDDLSTLGATVCGVRNPSPRGTVPVCSPLNLAYNLGLVIHAALILVGVALVARAWPPRRATTIGMWLISIGAVGAAAAGIFPFNVSVRPHSIGAVVNFLLGNLGIGVLGYALLEDRRGLAYYSLATAATGLIGALVFYLGLYGPLGRGTTERIAVYPESLWYVVMGFVLLAQGRLRREPRVIMSNLPASSSS